MEMCMLIVYIVLQVVSLFLQRDKKKSYMYNLILPLTIKILFFFISINVHIKKNKFKPQTSNKRNQISETTEENLDFSKMISKCSMF